MRRPDGGCQMTVSMERPMADEAFLPRRQLSRRR
ncbi:hypothetical protein C8D88_10769 [Lentzea atacamensis]|uniref:Uncharacterized protein n=1 Tax=Lentzea atacamensis TaxID=531938 RepID=A0A316HTZ5_9PSEU|nr:hypothetical protein C8D88_10769 [Lentzea atacamensis]